MVCLIVLLALSNSKPTDVERQCFNTLLTPTACDEDSLDLPSLQESSTLPRSGAVLRGGCVEIYSIILRIA
jgi:hypothetical protein